MPPGCILAFYPDLSTQGWRSRTQAQGSKGINETYRWQFCRPTLIDVSRGLLLLCSIGPVEWVVSWSQQHQRRCNYGVEGIYSLCTVFASDGYRHLRCRCLVWLVFLAVFAKPYTPKRYTLCTSIWQWLQSELQRPSLWFTMCCKTELKPLSLTETSHLVTLVEFGDAIVSAESPRRAVSARLILSSLSVTLHWWCLSSETWFNTEEICSASNDQTLGVCLKICCLPRDPIC